MGKIPVMMQRDVVLLNFPFSDLKTSKVRPVVVLSNDAYNKKSKDVLVVPLTSNLTKADYDIVITNDNLEKGHLIVDSRAKINRVFTVEKRLAKMTIGRIDKETFSEIRMNLSKLVG